MSEDEQFFITGLHNKYRNRLSELLDKSTAISYEIKYTKMILDKLEEELKLIQLTDEEILNQV